MARTTLGLLACVAALMSATPPVCAATDPEVVKGMKLVEEGHYDAGILTLDGASRRLATDPRGGAVDLPQAYLYMGIAFVGKGQDAAAKAQFREALLLNKGLTLSADRFAPKTISLFEAAREELRRKNSSARPGFIEAPEQRKSKLPLIVAGAGIAAGIVLATKGGAPPGEDEAVTTTFADQVLNRLAPREYAVEVKGGGTLEARVDWVEDRMLLTLSLSTVANPTAILATGLQTASKQTSLSMSVAPGSYRLVVEHAGNNPQQDATFTLTVVHP
jgi:hypothetical protein